MDSDDSGGRYVPCPNCGQTETNHIPVWELPETWRDGGQPDYMGCVVCHTMLPYEEWWGDDE